MYILECNKYLEKQNWVELQIKYKNIWYTFLIDKDDSERVKSRHWRTSHKKNKVYAVSGSRAKKNVVYLHNFILNYKYVSGFEVDHINGNHFDNRKSNLRVCSRLENIQNVGVRNDSQIGIRGIVRHKNKTNETYSVDFAFSKQRFYFPRWQTISEAIWCRKTAENYFGLSMIDRNPLATIHYSELTQERKEEIEHIVLQILRK